MDLRIGGVTFNVAEEAPSRDIGTVLLDQTGNRPDVFIVALQEVNLGLQIGALLFWDQWTEKVILKTLYSTTGVTGGPL